MPAMTFPTRDQFLEKAKQGNLIPVWREVLADMETPVSAFRKIAGGRANSFLLESVEGGEQLARYSFLGSDPFLVFRSKSDTADNYRGNASRDDCAESRRTRPAACPERIAGPVYLRPHPGTAAVRRRRGRHDRL